MDLVTDDVMLLDVGYAIYIWLGNECNEIEKKSASKAASEYLNSDPSSMTNSFIEAFKCPTPVCNCCVMKVLFGRNNPDVSS